MRIYESNTVVYTWSLGKSGKSLKRFSSQNYESSLRLFWSLSQVFQGGQVLPYLFRDMPIEAHGDLYDTQIWKITPKDITLCFFLSLSLSYQKKKKKCLLSVSLGVYATLFVKFHTSFFCDTNVNSEFRRILNENSNLWQGS